MRIEGMPCEMTSWIQKSTQRCHMQSMKMIFNNNLTHLLDTFTTHISIPHQTKTGFNNFVTSKPSVFHIQNVTSVDSKKRLRKRMERGNVLVEAQHRGPGGDGWSVGSGRQGFEGIEME